MQPQLRDSGTFISPVDLVQSKERGLSQVVSPFEFAVLGKRPFLSLVPTGGRYEFSVDGSVSSPTLHGSNGREKGLSIIDGSNVRPTLRSPPPGLHWRTRQRIIVYLTAFAALVVLVVVVLILASI
ncbi:hypothetical protein RRG08_017700 [Elysia crispata]|uniref:Uncharacterized protein n=1 Tax=Elysia crispata TaxID=231223 RepID=A0AAE1A0G9_9GAST|nr:hypothetical protein RRG08_062166 [Elysia crispata]KAK3779048.1 hypothetical protein RRG08_017700 [Elysia crispata]